MNRYSNFDPQSHDRVPRGGIYSPSGSESFSVAAAAAYPEPSNLDIFDYVKRERPRRVRPRRTPDFKSLYPSTHDLPEVPRAAVVFGKVGPQRPILSAPSFRSSEVRRGTLSRQDESFRRQDSSPNPVEDEYQDENSAYDRPLVEVSPGHWVELRGSDETWNALLRGFCKRIDCFCCQVPMEVIADAAMVLCPGCRMICPLDDVRGSGLGLGVKYEKVEEEIISRGSFHSDRPSVAKAPGKKTGELKDDNDSGHSIQCMRPPTTNLGAARKRSHSPKVVPRYR